MAEDPWFAGWCGVMVNLSDIAAMGGRPLAVVNALWDEAQPHAAQILQGMAAASRAYQVPIVGGHTNLRSDRSQLAVAVLGETASPLSSSAAQAGQTLMVAINLQGGGTRREITGTRRPARIPPNCAGPSRCCRSWPPREPLRREGYQPGGAGRDADDDAGELRPRRRGDA
ncbi:AIR synthase related protein [Klebsiella pneumoniae]|nr:AIR synthase related protein [Klebsiella pneumoniae]